MSDSEDSDFSEGKAALSDAGSMVSNVPILRNYHSGIVFSSNNWLLQTLFSVLSTYRNFLPAISIAVVIWNSEKLLKRNASH